jgi:prepilin-type N-terminal cleavage/methylation domain-containing protein
MQTSTDQPSPTKARRFRGDEAFTLIELLVVIVIIGVLSTVVIFSVTGIKDRGQSAACKADQSTLKVAEEAAYAQDGVYATEAQLKTNGLLEDESSLYNITMVGTAPNYTDYSLTAVAGSKCTA